MPVDRYWYLNLLCIAVMLVSLEGCVDVGCIPLGGGPSPEPDHALFGLQINAGADSAQTDWEELLFHNNNKRDYGFYLDEARLSMGPDGHSVLIGDVLFSFTLSPSEKITMPDSIHSINHSAASHSSRFITSVYREGRIQNSYDDKTRRYELNRVHSVLRHNNSLSETGSPIVRDTAEFVSEYRYRIRGFHDPRMANDGSGLFYYVSDQMHEVVIDSSGEIVDDFTYDISFELRYRSMDANGEGQTLKSFDNISDADNLPVYSVSPSGKYLAYQEGNQVFLVTREAGEVTKISKGEDPRFAHSSNLLHFKVHSVSDTGDGNNDKIFIYDPAASSMHQIETGQWVSSIAWGPDEDHVYYTGGGKLHRYDRSTEAHTMLMRFSTYQQRREERMDENSTYYVNGARLAGTSQHLYAIGTSDVGYVSEGPCE